MSVKHLKFHPTLLPSWSMHVCALFPGCLWSSLRLFWNNRKMLTQAWSLKGARKVDNCDAKASSFRVSSHVETPNQTSFTATRTNHVTHMDWTQTSDIIPSRSVYAHNQYYLCDCSDRSMDGWQCIGFQWTGWPGGRFSKSDVARVWLELSEICEFRVVIRIMTRLPVRCLWGTRGLRTNYHVKNLASLGFLIISCKLCGASQTASVQPWALSPTWQA